MIRIDPKKILRIMLTNPRESDQQKVQITNIDNEIHGTVSLPMGIRGGKKLVS